MQRTPLPTRRTVRRRFLRWLGLCVLALVAFEVGIRHISPDRMTYTETDLSGHRLFTYTSSQPRVVKGWYVYINGEQAYSMFAHCGMTLNEPPPIHHQFTFTWHGVPIESATSDTLSAFCYFYTLSAGGVPDPFDNYFLSNPHALSEPPPVGHQSIP